MINKQYSNGDSGLDIRNFINNHLSIGSVKNYGAIADGVTDDFQSIQDAVDDNDYVVIGNKNETFLISQPIYLNSNNRVQINGNVKLIDAVLTNLSSDATAGNNYIDVADASSYFAGQWVGITDDDKPFAGGGIGGNRDNRVGDGVRVASVTSTRITFETVLRYSYTTAANAQVGHIQSCFICQEVENVYISGYGS